MKIDRRLMIMSRQSWTKCRCVGCHLTGRRRGPDGTSWLWVDFSRGRGLCGKCARTPEIVNHYKELAK